jgi:hypothetical protein
MRQRGSSVKNSHIEKDLLLMFKTNDTNGKHSQVYCCQTNTFMPQHQDADIILPNLEPVREGLLNTWGCLVGEEGYLIEFIQARENPLSEATDQVPQRYTPTTTTTTAMTTTTGTAATTNHPYYHHHCH